MQIESPVSPIACRAFLLQFLQHCFQLPAIFRHGRFPRLYSSQPKLKDIELCFLHEVCSGLMKPDTHLGENARQIEVSDDQTTPLLFR